MKTYEIELQVDGVVFVEVEADDEDAAHDEAVTNWRHLFDARDVEIDGVSFLSAREVAT